MIDTAPNSHLRRSDRLQVLVFTTVFPNADQPLHGTFVLERIRHLANLADIEVVAPVPWFRSAGLKALELMQNPSMRIRHPRFWYIPKVLKSVRGVFLFCSAVREVGQLRRTFDFDLIDAHFAYPDGFAAVLLGWWFRRPVCITLRGTIIPLSRRPVGRWLCDWAIRRAERIIAVAENLAERARQGGVPEGRIETIRNGVSSKRFRLLDRISARKELGLAEKGRLLVSVGHLSPRKGFQRVIRSLPRIIERFPDARLAIVGGRGAEEDNRAALHALMERLGLSERVIFAGAETPDRVASWLGAADVFVLASDFEGCPNVILEALACGRPVVATKVGDIERMVPAFGGLLVNDPEDEIALAQSVSAALARQWDAQRIHRHVAEMSWESVAQRVATQWRLAFESYAQRSCPTSIAASEHAVTATNRSSES